MVHPYVSRNPQTGEVILAEVRPYPFARIGKWLIALLFLLTPFFFLVPLLQIGIWGAVLFAFILCIGVLLMVRQILIYAQTVLVVTNRRLIDLDQKGLFERVVSETTYDHVQDVSFSIKGIRQTLFDYGNVVIQTVGNQASLEVHDTRHPGSVHELIVRARSEAVPAQPPGENESDGGETPDDLVNTVRRLRSVMGKRDFRKLVKTLDTDEEIKGRNGPLDKK